MLPTIIIIGLHLLFVIGIIFCLWGMYCTTKTGKQRFELIDCVYENPNDENSLKWFEYSEMLDKVEFNQHQFSLMLFKDPYKLYNEELLVRLENYRIKKT